MREKRNINIFKMCGSRKYPYPTPHRRDWIFQGGGGVNLPHFPVGTGGHHREIFPEGSRDVRRVTKKKHKKLPQQFICEDIKHDES